MDARQNRSAERTQFSNPLSTGRPALRRQSRRAGLGLELLESRQLLSGMVVDVATLPAGVNVGPMTVARDGNLWFGQTDPAGATSLARVTPAGSKTVYKLPSAAAGGAIAGIAADPTGNTWYTVANASTVGRVAADGSVHEFSLNLPTERAGATAVAPDGSVWVALTPGATGTSPAIARVDVDGNIKEFPVAGATEIRSLTAASDGALWFVDGAKLGKMTPDGVVAEFPVMNATGAPADLSDPELTAGTDGDVWFLGKLGGVSKINASGLVSTLPTPMNAAPTSLARGIDGNLWFTLDAPKTGQFSDAPGALVVRMTPDGLTTVMADRADATASSVAALAATKDGALWFDEGAGKLGRMNLSSVPAISPPMIRPTTTTYISLAPGKTFSGSIVSFTPNRFDNTPVTYTANIDWGDGHVTPATVTPNATGGYDVNGTNTFNAPSNTWFSVRVSVTDSKGASAVIFNRVLVTGPNVPAWQNFNGNTTAPVSDSGPATSTPVTVPTTTPPSATGTPRPASTPVTVPTSTPARPTSTPVTDPAAIPTKATPITVAIPRTPGTPAPAGSTVTAADPSKTPVKAPTNSLVVTRTPTPGAGVDLSTADGGSATPLVSLGGPRQRLLQARANRLMKLQAHHAAAHPAAANAHRLPAPRSKY